MACPLRTKGDKLLDAEVLRFWAFVASTRGIKERLRSFAFPLEHQSGARRRCRRILADLSDENLCRERWTCLHCPDLLKKGLAALAPILLHNRDVFDRLKRLLGQADAQVAIRE